MDETKSVKDLMTPVVALYATTFSVAGAFYQSYLVRQKGWTRQNLKQGLIGLDTRHQSVGLITMMVLINGCQGALSESGYYHLEFRD